MNKIRFYCLFLAFLGLSACASQTPAPVRGASPQMSAPVANAVETAQLYCKIKTPKQCVPHAREVSGMEIYGDAHTWWRQAQGRYPCGAQPLEGAVMVLSKTKRLKYGHVAVVKNVIDSRTIEVEHANWGGDRQTRAIVYKRMPVKDVSPNNDWSVARFWNYPSQTFGRLYPVSGFIYPKNGTDIEAASAALMLQEMRVPLPRLKPVQ